MGRPPLGNRPITLRLPQSVLDRIERLDKGRKRQIAVFVREAVEMELERREAIGGAVEE